MPHLLDHGDALGCGGRFELAVHAFTEHDLIHSDNRTIKLGGGPRIPTGLLSRVQAEQSPPATPSPELGASTRLRSGNLDLGKVAFCQLNYAR